MLLLNNQDIARVLNMPLYVCARMISDMVSWPTDYGQRRENKYARVGLPPEIVNISKLSDLMSGRLQGRTSREQTTWFMNVGALGEQFTAITAAVYKKAREAGLGTEIPTDLFLENIRA